MKLQIPTSTLGIKHTKEITVLGVEGLSVEGVLDECRQGASFYCYPYCISILVMSFKRMSPIYFVRSSESKYKHGWKYIGITFFLGWWGVPWGPIWSIMTLVQNISGGKDVTIPVLAYIRALIEVSASSKVGGAIAE